MQAAAAAIEAEHGPLGAEVEMEGEIGILQIYGGAFAPVLALPVHQGVFHLQGAVVAMAQARGGAGAVDAEAGLGRQPVLPIGRCLHAGVEVLARAAGEAGQLAQDPKRQPGAKVQPVEAGQIGLQGHGPAQGPHGLGAEGRQFSGGALLQARGHGGDAGKGFGPGRGGLELFGDAHSDQAASGHPLLSQCRGPVSAGLGGPHQCFGQRFDSAQLHCLRRSGGAPS